MIFPNSSGSAEPPQDGLNSSGIPPLGHTSQRKTNAKALILMGLGALVMLGLLYAMAGGGDEPPPPTGNEAVAVRVPPPPPVLEPAPLAPDPVLAGGSPSPAAGEEGQALRLRRTATDSPDASPAVPHTVVRNFSPLPPAYEYRHMQQPEDPGLALLRKRTQPAASQDVISGAVSGGLTGGQAMPSGNLGQLAGTNARETGAPSLGEVTAFPVNAARRVPLQASSYIPQGTALRCVLQTEVITDMSGPVQCNLTEDVFSFDASRVLLPKGTRVLGEYRRADGSLDRVAIVWSRLITPANVDISVDSPGVTTLGAMGVPAYLDNRWADRFASALMVSLASDAFKIAVQKNAPTIETTTVANGVVTVTREPFDSVTVRNTERFVENDVASKMQIQPRLVIPQGSVVSILTAQDLNLSTVLGPLTGDAPRSGP